MLVSMLRRCSLLLAFLTLSSSAPAQTGAVADQQLKTRVEQRLNDRRVRGIKVAAQSGSVTLSGNLASAGAKQDLIADVLKVDGVDRKSVV